MSAIIGAIIAGAIVGALGRLILPGKQNISLVVTVLIGIVASFVAGFVLNLIFKYDNASGGIPWIAWIVGAIFAAIGITVYGNVTNKKV